MAVICVTAGTTAAARRAAAQQIGEIAKHHPYDLQNLLERVRVLSKRVGNFSRVRSRADC
jgi:hypothetical protein